ncbi:hypothetical protein [Maridesulfovibrio sp.]|uniref:hypothetical protein n=1 Tax=Maridesulfovibrio sp. TaxID=2795000 RepID=UPI0039EFACA1
MKTKFNFSAIVFLIILFNVNLAIAGWTTQTSNDEMDGTTNCFAHSQDVRPTKAMSFPYAKVRAWLGVGTDGKSEWAYIGFSEEPNIINKKVGNGYGTIKTRIKWGDRVEEISLTQDWGSKFIHFNYDSQIIAKIAKHGKVMIELDWFRQGKRYFVFSLQGSSAALAKIRNSCGRKK